MKLNLITNTTELKKEDLDCFWDNRAKGLMWLMLNHHHQRQKPYCF